MLQQFGRTHRSNQVCAPHYVLLVTDVGGEQRFASSVARRLELLGAMTRGDRRGGHGAAADLVQYNLDTVPGHAALAILLDLVAENVEKERLWERALGMLKCHREGVPTLLGLCVVSVAQHGLHPPRPAVPPPNGGAAVRAAALAKAEAAKEANKPHDISKLPPGLQQYISRLREWAKPKVENVQLKAERNKATESSSYGVCPKTPHKHGLTWGGCASALQRMRLLTDQNVPLADADRYNINKFLNRLLGLPVQTQNSLFAFYTQIFRWVAIAAKAQGKIESGVSVIQGESVVLAKPAEVVYFDPDSSAITEVHTIRVDSGLAFSSASKLLAAALSDPLVKSTTYGGSTGFWRQAKSRKLVLAIEMPSTSSDRTQRLHRILRPTSHPSSKPHFVAGPELRRRYECVRALTEAEEEWEAAYAASESARIKTTVLLTGAILPVWGALSQALGGKGNKKDGLPVKKGIVDGQPLIGVALSESQAAELRKTLGDMEGGRREMLAEKQKQVDGERERRKHLPALHPPSGGPLAASHPAPDASGAVGTTGSGRGGANGVEADGDDEEDDEEDQGQLEEEAVLAFSAEIVQAKLEDEEDEEVDDDDLLAMIGA